MKDKLCLNIITALTFLLIGCRAYGEVIYNNFDSNVAFTGLYNSATASIRIGGLGDSTSRSAARFSVTGRTYRLESITLPISVSRNVTNDVLKVSISEDSGGEPGTVLEVLSNGEDIWPAATTPFTNTTTLTSSDNPVLYYGSDYWVVLEPNSIPGGASVDVDFRWYYNTNGSTTAYRQQTTSSATLPTNPWSGFSGTSDIAFSVSATPYTPPIPTLSEYGLIILLILMAAAASRKLKISQASSLT